MTNKNSIILRKENTPGDYRFLDAEIKANGDLVFNGQDIGSGVESIFGYREYEWCWTIQKKYIQQFINTINEKGEILDLLEKNFSNERAAELHGFLKKNNIPFGFWSRVGD